MKRSVFRLFSEARCDRVVWRMDGARLRILMYHGVCEDAVAGQPWVPGFFVTRSAFESQLQYLSRWTCVLPLSEAVERLGSKTLPDRCVAVTFDDGYANNLHLAAPLLEKYGACATIFLATAYIQSGDFLPFDRLRLIRLAGLGANSSNRKSNSELLEYMTHPVDAVLERADLWWKDVKAGLTNEQRETLRPLQMDELKRLDRKLIDFGAHSHSHCILRNESPARREWELQQSIETVRSWTGGRGHLFAYPNGARGDFNEMDKSTLQSLHIKAALTTIPGANGPACDPLELRRYPVGLFHDENTFVAEITGFRSLLRSLSW